jgi:hypothetical protein
MNDLDVLQSLFNTFRTEHIDRFHTVSHKLNRRTDKIDLHHDYISMKSLACKASPPSKMVESVLIEELKWEKVKIVIKSLFSSAVPIKGRSSKWSLFYRLIGEKPMIRIEKPNELYKNAVKVLKFKDSTSFIICHPAAAARLMSLANFRLANSNSMSEPIRHTGLLNDIPVFTYYDVPIGEILVGEHCKDRVSGLVIAEGEVQISQDANIVKLQCPFGVGFAANGTEHYTKLLIEPEDYSLFYAVLRKLMNRIRVK